MKKTLNVKIERPQFVTCTGVTYSQVDYWYGHTRRDLKMDLIYPEDNSGKKFPCVVWVCGGAWLTMDRSAHLAYLSKLALAGFAVASVEYRTSNEAQFPSQIMDVKTAIRYLKANAARYRIDPEKIGIGGESAGGHLSSLAALCNEKKFEGKEWNGVTSTVKAACPWYPVSDFLGFPPLPDELSAGAPHNLMLGYDCLKNSKKAREANPVDYITRNAPPFLIIHGDDDHTVPYSQGVLLHDKLEEAGCDVTLLTVKGADHADIRFFQDKIWDEMIRFFKRTLG